MTPITLTPETSGSIHVDSVDVSKGVYAVNKYNDTFFVVIHNGTYALCKPKIRDIDFDLVNTSPTFVELILYYSGCQFYTLSGQRITLKKQLTIADLKDSDHVGFVDKSGRKGHIGHVGNLKFALMSVDSNGLTSCCNTCKGSGGGSITEAIQNSQSCAQDLQLAEIYLFATRTGSEDSLFGWLNK